MNMTAFMCGKKKDSLPIFKLVHCNSRILVEALVIFVPGLTVACEIVIIASTANTQKQPMALADVSCKEISHGPRT